LLTVITLCLLVPDGTYASSSPDNSLGSVKANITISFYKVYIWDDRDPDFGLNVGDWVFELWVDTGTGYLCVARYPAEGDIGIDEGQSAAVDLSWSTVTTKSIAYKFYLIERDTWPDLDDTSWSYEHSVSPSSPGTFEYKESDTTGDVTLYWKVTVVPTGPDLTADISWKPSTVGMGEDVEISIEVKNVGDETASNPEIKYFVDGWSDWKYKTLPSIPAGGSYTLKFTQTFPKLGSYRVKVVVDPSDKIDEKSETNNEVEKSIEVVDKTPPTDLWLIEDYCGRDWTRCNTPRWKWSARDEESGVKQYEVWPSWTSPYTTTDTVLNPTLSDGIYYVKVRAQNGSGIWSDWTSPVYVYIDTTAPSVQLTEVTSAGCNLTSDGWHISKPIKLSASCSDGGSGIASVTFWYRHKYGEGDPWGDWKTIGQKTTSPWEWDFQPPEGGGFYQLRVTCKDRAGNEGISDIREVKFVDVSRYFPIFYFTKDEKYFPVSFYFDGDADIGNNEEHYKTYDRSNPNKHAYLTTYYEEGVFSIEYWFYYVRDTAPIIVWLRGIPVLYPFRAFLHPHDWEGVTLFFSIEDLSKPWAIKYRRHGFRDVTYDWARIPKEGLHPLVYVAEGKHSSYASKGTMWPEHDYTSDDFKWTQSSFDGEVLFRRDFQWVSIKHVNGEVVLLERHPEFKYQTMTYSGREYDLVTNETLSGTVHPAPLGNGWWPKAGFGYIVPWQSADPPPWRRPPDHTDAVLRVIALSPVDLHLIDPLGRHVGLNYETGQLEIGIPGAQFVKGDNIQMIVVPNPITKETIISPPDFEPTYEVRVVGTEDGKYSLLVMSTIGLESSMLVRENIPIRKGEVKSLSLAPNAPLQSYPENGTFINDNTPRFQWFEVWSNQPVVYRLQVDDSPEFSSPEIDVFVEENGYASPLPLADGTYHWRVCAIVGNKTGPWSPAWTFTIDTVPPVSKANRIIPYWQNKQTVVSFQVTATAEDQVPPSGAVPSGLRSVELFYRYSKDNKEWGPWIPYGVDSDGSDGWSWVLELKPDGENDGYYEFYTVATDVAGNVEAPPENADACAGVDTVPPVSSVDPLAYWQLSVPFEITASAEDLVPPSGAVPSGLARVRLYYRHSWDNETWSDWVLFGADNSAPWSWEFDAPAGYGFYQVYTSSEDIAGNLEEPPEKPDQEFCLVIPATIDIDPDTLNIRSKGRWITCYIELPIGYPPENILVSSVALEGENLFQPILQAEPWPTGIGDHDSDGIPDLMVKFSRAKVENLVQVGENIALTVFGLWGKIPFRGSDNIRVINPGNPQKLGVLVERWIPRKPEAPPGLERRGFTPPGQEETPPGQERWSETPAAEKGKGRKK